MPFGLCNAPGTFQRLMERIFGAQHGQSLLLYLDDIIVFSSNVDDHLSRMDLVLSRLQQEGLKGKMEKCCMVDQCTHLAFADFTLPFILEVYASHIGLGAVLSLEQDGKVRAIAYASRSLNPAEKNYSSMKLEFLGMKWAMTDTFRDYLCGQRCVVWTDNNPLTHLGTAKLGATEQCWVAELAVYDYTIRYRSDRSNRNADALSRQPPSGPVDASGLPVAGTAIPGSVQQAVRNKEDIHVI